MKADAQGRGCFWPNESGRTGVISRAAALFIAGAPRGIRTLDLEIRSLLLYPAELWAHACWRMDDYSLWTGRATKMGADPVKHRGGLDSLAIQYVPISAHQAFAYLHLLRTRFFFM